MSPAPEPDPRDAGPAAARDFVYVIELETCARRTTAAGFAHERASALIALPDRAPDVGRERAIEYLRHISGGDLVAQQLLGVAQLVVGALAHGELEAEALCGQRSYPRSL